MRLPLRKKNERQAIETLNFVSLFGNNILSLHYKSNKMGTNKLKVVLTEEETLVIATHGIVKKTQKTPQKEITKAEEIRKEYFNNKKK